jgi:hypothetical protein
VEVVGESYKETTGDVIGEPSCKSCSDPCRASHEIAAHQHREASVPIGLFSPPPPQQDDDDDDEEKDH